MKQTDIEEEYPFVKEFITDATTGQICKVVLSLEDYQSLIETIEDAGLNRAMQEVIHEKPISREEALCYLNSDEG